MYNPDIFTALHNLDVALCSKINALDKRVEGLHAMETCRGNKKDAAKMLGLSNYQTLTNWIIKHGVEV